MLYKQKVISCVYSISSEIKKYIINFFKILDNKVYYADCSEGVFEVAKKFIDKFGHLYFDVTAYL